MKRMTECSGLRCGVSTRFLAVAVLTLGALVFGLSPRPSLAAEKTNDASAASTSKANQAKAQPFADERKLLATPVPPAVPPGFTSTKQAIAGLLGRKLTMLPLNQPIPNVPGVTVHKDVEYGRAGLRRLLLDLYLPDGLTKPTPALLFIHGGGWKGGKKEDYAYYCIRYAARGYVVASVSYRLVGEATFPACIHDVKCAVRWMRAQAKKYHIDPKRIAAIGGSAGGHLSMMLGYSAGVAELEGQGGWPDQSSAVQAVVNLYGPTDLTVEVARTHPTVVEFMGGKSYDDHPEMYKLASPLHHLDKDDAPTLILHGTIDDLVPIEQADMLAGRLAELGIPYDYDRLHGYPHTMDVAKEVNLRCRWFINRFLERQFKMTKTTAEKTAAK